MCMPHWSRGSHFATEAGDEPYAARLRARAADLKARFNRDFWLEERGWLAMGLDRDKRPLDALTSNMGHCLWTGILDEDKAAIVGAAPRCRTRCSPGGGSAPWPRR